MAKYVYPAVFTEEKNGGYSIVFNDLESCYTCADTLIEAMEMAKDVLSLVLYNYEADGKELPKPGEIKDIKLSENEFVNYIVADTGYYRKLFSKKSIKKTLTIPEYMNNEAIAMGINFSQVLQEALELKLHCN